MTNTFCPLLREKCKESECVMFRDNNCLLVSFFENIEIGAPTPEQITPPDWLKEITVEKLAEEILEFAKNEKTALEYYSGGGGFWESKGFIVS
jgi:hypothetical protein